MPVGRVGPAGGGGVLGDKVHRSDVVLVTGVRSGIGLRLARRLWDSSYRVVATARAESLAQLQEEEFRETDRFRLRGLDVTDPDRCAALVDEIERDWGGVDALINNAGISYRSVQEHMTREDELRQLTTNTLAPLELARLVLPSMRRKRRGRIINVSSVSGMMAMPTMGSYSASKWALEGASEALWYEARPWNVHVTLVQPGFIHSHAFERVAWSDKARNHAEEGGDYANCYRHMSQFIAKLMNHARATPETVADRILRVVQHRNPPLRVPVTIDAHFFSLLRRLLPRRLYHAVLYRALPGVKTWDDHE